MERRVYKGLNVDFWSREQTMHPKPEGNRLNWYTGYEALGNMRWYDFGYPEIPLHIRYESFSRRLDAAKARAGL